MASLRGPCGITLRRCLATTALPTALAALIALIAHGVAEPRLDGGDAPGASTPWLTLPMLVAALGCCLTAACLWPTFAARRPGADTISRLERGPLGGRGAVIAGALIAQLLLTVPLTTVLARGLDAPAMARRHIAAEPPPSPLLLQNGDVLRFSLPADTTVTEIWLRPIAAMPTGPLQATEVVPTTAGRPLAATPIAFEETRELVRVRVAPRSLTQFELTRTTGTVPLFFPRGSVVAVGPADLPEWQNGLVAALFAGSTSLLALVLAALLGLTAGWPTVVAVIGCAHLVQWIAGVGPVDEALLALLRGQWLLATT